MATVRMWSLLLLLSIAPPDPVASEGEPRLILQGGSNPCEGYIEIYYKDQWGIVGDIKWNKNNDDVVCRSIGCGKSNSSSNMVRPNMSSHVWLNELVCNGTENQLWDCHGNRGWGISEYPGGTVKKIQCSEKIETSLDGFRCAGAVQYKKTSTGETGYFCSDKWTSNLLNPTAAAKDEAELVCKTLKCGQLRKIPDAPVTTPMRFRNAAKTKISCLDTKHQQNLWQCAPQPSPSCQSPVSVICSDHPMLRLKGEGPCDGNLEMQEGSVWKPVTCQNNKTSYDEMCKQMHCGTSVKHECVNDSLSLTCSGKVTVTLRDETKCYGEVHINSDSDSQGPRPVCGSSWEKKNGEVVCRELNCGKLISTSTVNIQSRGNPILDQVKCSGDETSLWHCPAKYDRNPRSCRSTAYIVCSGSVTVRLSDGPGICAGRVEIKYNGQWMRAQKSRWTESNSDVVCKDLKCGKAITNLHKFTRGSAPFLNLVVNCEPNATNISDCITEETIREIREQDTVEITCQDHKVVFLKGQESCSGRVGVEHAGKTYWLSGSNKTWTHEAAELVCQQMHCGNATEHERTERNATMENEADIWREFYNCSSTDSSLFDCRPVNNETVNSEQWNASVAVVHCSGKTTVTLEKCLGKVEACVNGACGGVCEDAWTKNMSEMLCENMGCGHRMDNLYPLTGSRSPVSVKSFHLTQQTTKLSESNIVLGDRHSCFQAQVVCSGSIKALFKVTGDRCTGNLEILYQGRELPVCRAALTNNSIPNICRDLQCGEDGKQLEFFGPPPESPQYVSALECASNETSLTACNIKVQKQSCVLGGIQCSEWRKMGLKQPKESDKACAGDVFVESEGRVSAVSSEGWTDEQVKKLCKDLSCSNYKLPEEMPESSLWWEKSFNCTNATEPRNIWDCEHEKTPSLKEQLNVSCKAPKVNLSNKCSGELKIDDVEVCGSNWNIRNSHIVCQEQMCSNAITFQTSKKAASSPVKHVICDSTRGVSTLGQCKIAEGKCNNGLVSVYCADCVKFNTTEKCGGQVKVKYRDDWEFVCPLNSISEQLLCKKLGCGEVINHTGADTVDEVNLETSLTCTEAHLDIRNCVEKKGCGKGKPAEIYCSGYTIIKPPPPDYFKLIVGLIAGGLCLIMVISLFLFLRGWILKNVKSRTTRKETEYESEEYEDVASNTSQMKDLIRMGSRPETAVMAEIDERRASTFSYDDIDEEAVAAQPLTSERQAANEAIAYNINKYATVQNSVTYEVDDPQDSYDDITEAQVEVHISPKTQPRNDHEALPRGLEGAGDYLEPDQDG